MTNQKKAIVVSIMGVLVKKTPSRHYWLYNGTKWQRLGLTKIAGLLKVSADIVKAAVFTAAKKALASVADADKVGSHASVLWYEALALTLFAVVYLVCYTLAGPDEGFFMAVPISQGLALWLYHKVVTCFKSKEGSALA